ncbi:MAG TPA: ATP-binding protein [Mycobacteriales bacterium]|nr:ATP-binding protein [Mycobacteriales bacterium]
MPDQLDGGYDGLPDGVVVCDPSGTVRRVNPSAERILGRPAAELVGHPLTDVIPLCDPMGHDWWACTRPFDGLSTRVRQPERLLTFTRPGHPDRDLLVTAAYLRDEGHRLMSFVICLRDTSARDRRERSAAELVTVVAHELRSPLTSVKGFTATLLAKWDRFTDEQKLHMLNTVSSDADRLSRLITELLDVSRIETGYLELRKQVVDLPEIVRGDVAGRVAAGEPESRFVVRDRSALPEIWADRDKVSQVIGNVVENALRHGAGTVTITIEPADDGVAVEVVDEGEGIAVEAMPRIFTKFWHDPRRGGTGLGLFIAKGIVDAHGGDISASAAASGGAAVRFRLPAGQPEFLN